MKKLLLAIPILLLLIIGVGFLLPTDYSLESSVDISATPEEIHVFVGDLEKWPEWSPWEETDESIVTTTGEITTGVGATQTWTSDSGDGELTITRSDPATGIAYDMAFIMEGTRAPATSQVTYKPNGETTTVTWSMQGDVSAFAPPVIGGYMTLFMKGAITGMFDQGLDNLKKTVEAQN